MLCLDLLPLHSMCWQKFTAHDFWNICLTIFHCSYSVLLASSPWTHSCLVKIEERGQRLHWACATSIYVQEKKCREETWARFSYLHVDFEKLWKEVYLFLLLEHSGWVQRVGSFLCTSWSLTITPLLATTRSIDS